jgi:hypothetical protein
VKPYVREGQAKKNRRSPISYQINVLSCYPTIPPLTPLTAPFHPHYCTVQQTVRAGDNNPAWLNENAPRPCSPAPAAPPAFPAFPPIVSYHIIVPLSSGLQLSNQPPRYPLTSRPVLTSPSSSLMLYPRFEAINSEKKIQ